MKPTPGIEKMGPAEFRAHMLARLEENDNLCRGLAHDAFLTGDQETLWYAKAQIAQNERTRAKLPN